MKTENKNDRTESLRSQIAELRSHGGKLSLPCDSYDISASLVLDSSSSCIEGDVWSCNTDPHGVFEADHGTKLRMHGRDFPALIIGRESDPVSGAIVRDIGIQGDLRGMDTRPITDFSDPSDASGLCIDSVRVDQCEFSKISFCGLSSAVCATKNAEIDACIFEKLNTDGCGNGFYFAPRASFYARVRACIMADNPYYGFYAGGKGKMIHNLEILDCHFVRNGGGFSDSDGHIPAALLFDNISRCAVTHCIFDDPGTFWYYDENARYNEERQPSHRKAVALYVIGNENRIRDNTFLRSSDDSIRIEGDRNILLSNIVDGNVRISGKDNTVVNLIFTKPTSRLILEGDAKESTVIIGLPEDKIVRI